MDTAKAIAEGLKAGGVYFALGLAVVGCGILILKILALQKQLFEEQDKHHEVVVALQKEHASTVERITRESGEKVQAIMEANDKRQRSDKRNSEVALQSLGPILDKVMKLTEGVSDEPGGDTARGRAAGKRRRNRNAEASEEDEPSSGRALGSTQATGEKVG